MSTLTRRHPPTGTSVVPPVVPERRRSQCCPTRRSKCQSHSEAGANCGTGSGSFWSSSRPARQVFVYRWREKGTKTTGKVNVGPYDATGEFMGERTVGSPQTLTSARRNVGILREERKAGVDIFAKYRVEKHSAKLAVAAIRSPPRSRSTPTRSAPRASVAGLRPPGCWGWTYSDQDNPTTIKGSLCDRWRDKSVRDIDPGMIAMVVDEAIPRRCQGARLATQANTPRHAGGNLPPRYRRSLAS